MARLGSAEKKQKCCSRQEVVGREVPLEEEGKVRKLGSFRAKDGVDVLEGLDLKYLAGILKTTYDEDAWSNEYELEGTQPDKGGRHAVAMSLQNIKKLRDDWGWLKRTETAFAPTKVRSVRLVVMRYAGMFTIENLEAVLGPLNVCVVTPGLTKLVRQDYKRQGRQRSDEEVPSLSLLYEILYYITTAG